MIDSLFNSEVQVTTFQTITKMMEKYLKKGKTGDSANILSDYSGAPYDPDNTVTGSFADIIEAAAIKNNVDARLIQAVMDAESGGNPQAVSSAGAVGLMQLMPSTAQMLGVSDPTDPVQNVNAGAKLLRQLIDDYGGNVGLGLAAYNAGPGAVSEYGGLPPYKETRNYVKKIMTSYHSSNQWSA